LMQITRQRVRTELQISTNEMCPTCLGTGTVTPSVFLPEKIEESLRFLVNERNVKNLILKVHPFIYAYLKKGFPSTILKWKFKYSQGIKALPSDSLGFLEYKIFDKDNKEVDLK